MNFFETLSQLREIPTDVTHFPHRQLASKVFGMVAETYMANWDNPVTLRPDVSPEMLEACFSRIFGKTLMTQVIERLPILAKQYEDMDVDDMYMDLIGQRKLLGAVAMESAWGSPATEDADELSFLIFCLLLGSTQVKRFVTQVQKRIATVH